MPSTSRLALAALVVASFASVAAADVVVGWTIPTAFPTNPPPTGTTYSVGAADQGANALGSSLSGTHASTSTAWTSPAGNGSQYSFSSNNWAIGDYYEARFATTGYTDLSLSWDQARSSTGPLSWEVIISTDGGSNFTTLLNYDVLQSGGGGAPGTWSSGSYNPIYTSSLLLSAGVRRSRRRDRPLPRPHRAGRRFGVEPHRQRLRERVAHPGPGCDRDPRPCRRGPLAPSLALIESRLDVQCHRAAARARAGGGRLGSVSALR
jgi:hypothetical protein